MPIESESSQYSAQMTYFLTKYVDKIDMTIRKVVIN